MSSFSSPEPSEIERQLAMMLDGDEHDTVVLDEVENQIIVHYQFAQGFDPLKPTA